MKIFALLVALVVLVNQYVLVQGLIRDTILDDLRYSTPMVETSEVGDERLRDHHSSLATFQIPPRLV